MCCAIAAAQAHRLITLDEIDLGSADYADVDAELDAAAHCKSALVQGLKPLDREVFVLYLEGLSWTTSPRSPASRTPTPAPSYIASGSCWRRSSHRRIT